MSKRPTELEYKYYGLPKRHFAAIFGLTKGAKNRQLFTLTLAKWLEMIRPLVPKTCNDTAYWRFGPYFSSRLGRKCRPPCIDTRDPGWLTSRCSNRTNKCSRTHQPHMSPARRHAIAVHLLNESPAFVRCSSTAQFCRFETGALPECSAGACWTHGSFATVATTMLASLEDRLFAKMLVMSSVYGLVNTPKKLWDRLKRSLLNHELIFVHWTWALSFSSKTAKSE